MNEVIRQLKARKSVRMFEDREIEEPLVREILDAATQAPTAGNQQLYTILRITDQEKKERLSESCDHQPFIAQAKLVLVFCADCLKWYKAYRFAGCEPRLPGAGDLMLAVTDAAIAAQNAVVAAESLGIGSCYIGDIMENCEVQREILGLPEYVFPAAMLVFGYPTEQQRNRKKPARSDLDCIVFEDRYPEMDEALIRDMLGVKCPEEQGYDRWIRAFCKRKYDSDFSREMTWSVEAYLKQYRDVRLVSALEDRRALIPLYEEYARMLVETDPVFQRSLDQQNYDEEIAHLEEKYGLPRGRIYLVYVGNELAGCVGMKPFDDQHAELKRLYVRLAFRGRNLGERLVRQIMEDARAEGYRWLRLDTLPGLRTARKLYQRMGFREIDAYYDCLVPGTIFMEIEV